MKRFVFSVLSSLVLVHASAFGESDCDKDIAPNRVASLLKEQMAEARRDPRNTEAHICVGQLSFMTGNFSAAEAAFRSALKSNKSELREADILQGLASSIKYLGKYDEAIALLQRKLVIDEKYKNKDSRSQTYATLASIYGDKRDSIKSIEMALASVDDLKSHYDKSATYNNVAMAYVDLDVFDKAHFYIDKAIALDERYQSFRYLGIHKINKGGIFKKEGKYHQAIQAYRAGIPLVSKEGDQYWEMQGYSSLAASLFKSGNTPEAIKALKSARVLARALGRTEEEAYFSDAIESLSKGLAGAP